MQPLRPISNRKPDQNIPLGLQTPYIQISVEKVKELDDIFNNDKKKV